MVAVAQLVERWIVVPLVVGSNPIGHPSIESNSMKIEYICFLDKCGYGYAAKGYINKLIEMGHAVSIIPIDAYVLEEYEISIKQNIKKPIGTPNLRIVHVVPHIAEGLIKNDGVPTIFFYAWELSVLPEVFKKVLEKVKHCVTFSEWQVEVYKRCLKKSNISYIPHIMPLMPSPIIYKKSITNIFTFLSIFRGDERKDPWSLLKAFSSEFINDNNARLVIKVQDTNSYQMGRMIQEIKNVSPQTIESAGPDCIYLMNRDNKNPTIKIITSMLKKDEMKSLYLNSNIFVSTTRSEGWGFCFNEALLCGIPCIYPDSPYIVKKFFTKENSIGVPCYDIPVSNWSVQQLAEKGTVWSQVNVDALRKVMRSVYTNNPFKTPVSISQEYLREQSNIENYLNNILSKVI